MVANEEASNGDRDQHGEEIRIQDDDQLGGQLVRHLVQHRGLLQIKTDENFLEGEPFPEQRRAGRQDSPFEEFSKDEEEVREQEFRFHTVDLHPARREIPVGQIYAEERRFLDREAAGLLRGKRDQDSFPFVRDTNVSVVRRSTIHLLP